jgi:hypothetical protein
MLDGKDHAALQAAEKQDSVTSAAKAFTDSRAFTAALKALRHPKPEFFPACLAVVTLLTKVTFPESAD